MHNIVESKFKDAEDVVFFHLQTVWEGTHVNTPENGPKVIRKMGNKVPVAYDAHVDGGRVSVFMRQYGTGGTPWTVVIDKKGTVVFNEGTPTSPSRLAAKIQALR